AEEHVAFSPRVAAGAVRSRLEDYLIADEVEVIEETARWVAIGVFGLGSGRLLTGLGVGVSGRAGEFFRSGDGFVFPGRFSRDENFWLLMPRADVAAWQTQLSGAGASRVEFAAAERERIQHGIPSVPEDIGSSDLPNEGGLEVDAISYTKGCYLGQEVMSRLKNLGQVRRRLHVVRGKGSLPAPRAALYQGEKQIGEIRSVAPESDGFVALAMLSLVNLDRRAAMSLASNQSPSVSLVDHG
ncbi:MAG: folate-binding protein, partial [Candidatus Didemnitutus sp.]|nr:folate-binding protein [Candidatus Didemnitutus sp.]